MKIINSLFFKVCDTDETRCTKSEHGKSSFSSGFLERKLSSLTIRKLHMPYRFLPSVRDSEEKLILSRHGVHYSLYNLFIHNVELSNHAG